MNDILFINSYAKLPEAFYSKTNPTPVKQPRLFKFNNALAEELGLTSLGEHENTTDYFSGNQLFEGAEPIAMAYSGHQFGGFSPQLGDGRAILLAEVKTKGGGRYDIQLKGSGPTPWSRGGDGRSALGPVIREYLVSEAMHKLGVPSTRALAAVTTGQNVMREKPTSGGILTRVATGFVRVGTFQYFASQGNIDALKQLAAYEIGRHYPDVKSAENPYAEFLRAVVDAQAKLIAKWMSLGFIHGVMNTDNMSTAGETIDYGPCAFMDDFSHDRKYSSIDKQGRYAYNNQPQMAQWNLTRFAETLLPLFAEYVDVEEDKIEAAVIAIAQESLNNYEGLYKRYWLNEMRQKLGLAKDDINHNNDRDYSLITRLLDIMQAGKADFTLTFYHLSQDINESDKARALFESPESAENFDAWVTDWQKRSDDEVSSKEQQEALMQSVNPVYIPRNHQIETAIRAAKDNDDFSKFEDLHAVLEKPFEYQTGKDDYMLPPKPEEVVQQTFCGT